MSSVDAQQSDNKKIQKGALHKFMLQRSKSSLDLAADAAPGADAAELKEHQENMVKAVMRSMRPPEAEVSSTASSSNAPAKPSAAPVAPSAAPEWFVENPGVTSPDDDQCADQAGEVDGLVPLGDGTFFRAPGCNVPLGANIPLASWIEQETSAENLVSHKLNPCLI